MAQKLVLQFRATDEEWTIYLPPHTPVRCTTADTRTVIEVAEGFFSGTVRLALSNNCTHGTSPICDAPGEPNTNLAEFRSALDSGSSQCITSAVLGFEEVSDAIRTSVTWNHEKCWPHSKAVGNVFLYALPHQTSMFSCEEGAEVRSPVHGGGFGSRVFNWDGGGQ